jgi:hypothetical protein
MERWKEMIKLEEFGVYLAVAKNVKHNKQLLTSLDGEGISKLSGECTAYYARLSDELADIKDAIDIEFKRLVEEDMGSTMAVRVAEVNVIKDREVSRRDIQYLLQALDRIAMSAAVRLKVLSKEK